MSRFSPSRRQGQESGEGRTPIALAESTLFQAQSSVGGAESSRSKIETIEKEVSLLKLRRADVHKRIRALRNAVVALIKVFGPTILDLETQGRVHFRHVPSRARAPIDVCRDILRESPHSQSFDRILELARERAPETVAEFKNPGVAISNALRSLKKRGEVEHLKNGNRGTWRWKPEPRTSSDTCHQRWSHESQLPEGRFFRGQERGSLSDDS